MAKGSITGDKAKKFAERAKSERFTYMINSEVKPFLKKNAKVADFCSGSGNIVQFFKSQNLTLIEDSREMAEILREKFGKSKKIRIIKGDVTSLSLKSKAFDAIIIKFSLHHIKNGSAAFKEAYRLLKPGGKFFVIDMVFKSSFIFRLAEPFFKLKKAAKHGMHEIYCKYRNEKEIEELAKEAGFIPIRKKQASRRKTKYQDRHYPDFIYVFER